MAEKKEKNPLKPCPATPNCVRTKKSFKAGIEMILGNLTEIFEREAHSFKVKDPREIRLHAVYRIPVFGFKDDVDVVLKESNETTTVFIRSASRLGAYDLGVNKRRIKGIFRQLNTKIQQ